MSDTWSHWAGVTQFPASYVLRHPDFQGTKFRFDAM